MNTLPLALTTALGLMNRPGSTTTAALDKERPMKLDYRIPLKALAVASLALSLGGAAFAESANYRVILPDTASFVATGGGDGGDLCDGDEIAEVDIIKKSSGNLVRSIIMGVDGNIFHTHGSDLVKRSGDDYSILWEYTDHSGIIEDLALGPDGHIVLAGGAGENVRKINSGSGGEIWEHTHPQNRVLSVAVSPDGAVYAGGRDNRLYKASATGDHEWIAYTHDGNVVAAVTDQTGNVYSASLSSSGLIAKHNLDGSLVWENSDSHWRGISVLHMDPSSGDLVSGGHDGSRLIKSKPSTGGKEWQYNGHSDSIRAIGTDSAGNIYSGSYDNTIRKISPSGDEIWVHNVDENVEVIMVHPTGTLYVAFGDRSIRKFAQSSDTCTSD
ncbi:hypothetical protein TK90_2728 (plasmid) [Thioalkalivibrio sp. K90mix]|uniref:WD40 repeat domain-containing protein n=1 Tax=Thioalkalivibrio sp. (strain K90mix) TaxID=396595 RepID=UPI000195A557|nr:WD40 repeat domain-containing protein [Thioalkalivibrio sp. K90mix]ADC73214.1 hypothetical protein TK90_2728 [Thioalkalivibrio sp. K90mix]